jgi:hypothetical protein
MWQSGVVAKGQTEERPVLTDFYRLRYAGFWNRAEIVVPLHCIRKDATKRRNKRNDELQRAKQ